MPSKSNSTAKAKSASRGRAKTKSSTAGGRTKPAHAANTADKPKVTKKAPPATPNAAARESKKTRATPEGPAPIGDTATIAAGAGVADAVDSASPTGPSDSQEKRRADVASSGDAPSGSAYQTEAPRIVPPRSKVTGAARGLAWFTLVVALVVAVAAITWPWWSERFAGALPFLKTTTQQGDIIKALSGRLQALEQKTDDLSAAKSDTLKQLESERARVGEELKTLIGRLTEVETSVRETRGLLKAGDAREQTQAATQSLKALSERLANLEKTGGQYSELDARIEKIEKGKVGLPTGTDADPQIKSDLTDVRTRLSQLESERQASMLRAAGGVSDAKARAIVLAVAQLRDSVRLGLPLAEDLEALTAVSGDNSDISDAIAHLQKYSKSGVPTVASLRAKFSDLAGTVVAVGQTPEAETWFSQAISKMSSLVRIRRVGEAAPPGSLDAAVADVDALLAAGDLKGAVDKLATIDSKAATAAASWLTEARARLEAEKAVASLHVHAVSLLAPAKAGG